MSLMCICERESSGLVPSSCPSSSFSSHPCNQHSSNTPIIYMTWLLPPLTYDQMVCGLMHITADVGSSLINVRSRAFVPFVFSSYVHRAHYTVRKVWAQHNTNLHSVNRMYSKSDRTSSPFPVGYQICFPFALLCVGTGGLAHTGAPKAHRPDLRSETGCCVTSIC